MQETTVTLLMNPESSTAFVQVVATAWLTYSGQTIHIQFSLIDSPQGSAFPTDPISWDPGQEPAKGDWGVEVSNCGQTAVLWQTNVNMTPMTRSLFGFRIGVAFEDNVYYSPDPTIMNQGPVGQIQAPPTP